MYWFVVGCVFGHGSVWDLGRKRISDKEAH